MTTPDRQPAADNENMQVESGDAAQAYPEKFAVSPAVGGLPAIYVPQSPAGAGLWRTTIRAARRAGRRAAVISRIIKPRPNRARSEHAPTGETMTDFPADLRYGKDHLWARPDDDAGLVRVGVTDFAQQSLGDVVEVTLPRLGEPVKAGEPCGDIESTKSVSDLIAPVTGTVHARNGDLADSPELVNSDPYGQGWMLEVEADPATVHQQLAALLDATAYRKMVGE